MNQEVLYSQFSKFLVKSAVRIAFSYGPLLSPCVCVKACMYVTFCLNVNFEKQSPIQNRTLQSNGLSSFSLIYLDLDFQGHTYDHLSDLQMSQMLTDRANITIAIQVGMSQLAYILTANILQIATDMANVTISIK